MRLYKGTLYDYFAPGEPFHYYCWLGAKDAVQHDWGHHLIISQYDIVEVISPNTDDKIMIYNFPRDTKQLEKALGKENMKLWARAVSEHWSIEVCRFGEPFTDG